VPTVEDWMAMGSRMASNMTVSPGEVTVVVTMECTMKSRMTGIKLMDSKIQVNLMQLDRRGERSGRVCRIGGEGTEPRELCICIPLLGTQG
jgi:hypothetical protein